MFEAASRVAHSDTLSTRGFCPTAGPRKQVRVSAAPRGKAAGAWSGGWARHVSPADPGLVENRPKPTKT